MKGYLSHTTNDILVEYKRKYLLKVVLIESCLGLKQVFFNGFVLCHAFTTHLFVHIILASFCKYSSLPPFTNTPA